MYSIFHFRFLPDGSYISARNKSIEKLAETIESIIENPSIYNSFHDWRQHYVIKQTRKLEGICDLCSNLNDKNKFKKRTAVKHFRHWWYDGSKYERCKIEPDPTESIRRILKESDLVAYYKGLKSRMILKEHY